jgi:hypothetical protein
MRRSAHVSEWAEVDFLYSDQEARSVSFEETSPPRLDITNVEQQRAKPLENSRIGNSYRTGEEVEILL